MNEHKVQTAAGMLLGMAAGAAVGAAGVMAAVQQNPRGVRKAARKMANGAEQAVGRLDRRANDLIARFCYGPKGKKRLRQALRPAAFFCVGRPLYSTATHIRAARVVSPSRSMSISMEQVTSSERLTLLPVSTDEGRFLMVRTAVPSSRLPDSSPS